MLIFDEKNYAIILDSVVGPLASDYMYVLDLNIMDYTLAPLLILEEIDCPTITIRIRDFAFNLPAHWNLLIADEETSQLDVVEIGDLSSGVFKAVVYGINSSMITLETIFVCDYISDFRNIGPSLNKYNMLCHPISPSSWVNVAPSDSFNKYLKNTVIGDLI